MYGNARVKIMINNVEEKRFLCYCKIVLKENVYSNS